MDQANFKGCKYTDIERYLPIRCEIFYSIDRKIISRPCLRWIVGTQMAKMGWQRAADRALGVVGRVTKQGPFTGLLEAEQPRRLDRVRTAIWSVCLRPKTIKGKAITALPFGFYVVI
jgi:hypothetical protein